MNVVLTADRYSMMGALVLTVLFVFITFFAKNFGMVLAGTTINNVILAFVSAVARGSQLAT